MKKRRPTDSEMKSPSLQIEGDNLKELGALRKAYVGQVNLIYVDPPLSALQGTGRRAGCGRD